MRYFYWNSIFHNTRPNSCIYEAMKNSLALHVTTACAEPSQSISILTSFASAFTLLLAGDCRITNWLSKSKLSYYRRWFEKSVLVSGTFWVMRYFFRFHGKYFQIFANFFSRAPSLTRGRPIIDQHSSYCVFYHCRSRVQLPQDTEPYLTVSFETKFSFCCLLSLSGQQWKYSIPPPYG
jgi:hypothetical protein